MSQTKFVIAIEDAAQKKLDPMEHSRMALECAKLDPGFERAMAEAGLLNELIG